MLIGNFPCKPASEGYTPPADWPNIDNCPDHHIQLIVNDGTLATYAFVCTTTTGQYSVNWGDGTTTLHNSGATAEHTYTIGTGQACSRGYTTFVVDISPVEEGDGLTSFKVQKHSLTTQTQYHGILGCVMNSMAADLSYAFYVLSPSEVICNMLEFTKIKQALNAQITDYMFNNCYSLQSVELNYLPMVYTATLMFSNCYSLKSIDLSAMTGIDTAGQMFNNCYTLRSVKLGTKNSLLNAGSMFIGCRSLQTIDVSSMPNVTSVKSMFNSCYSLQSVNLGTMPNVTDAEYMFSNCYSLKEIVGLSSLGSAATTTTLSNAFAACERLLSVTLPNTKISKIGIYSVYSSKPLKVNSFTFSSSSLFEGTSPQIDLRYCAFDATQLNALFTSLPTLSSKTINITGCTGAATCNRSIATAKGWTVTG